MACVILSVSEESHFYLLIIGYSYKIKILIFILCNQAKLFRTYIMNGNLCKGGDEVDDKHIIELYWQRSENALRETSSKYGKLCLHLAKNMLWNLEDAEECVNDTYLTAWNTIPPERPNNLCAFILKITRNLTLKKIEYNTAKKRNPELELTLSEIDDICCNGNVEHQIEVDELARSISIFLRTQDSINRDIFIRRYWYYDSISDISLQYNISENNVKSILYRMRNKLKEYLIKEGYFI